MTTQDEEQSQHFSNVSVFGLDQWFSNGSHLAH